MSLRVIDGGVTVALARIRRINLRTSERRSRWEALVAMTEGRPVANDNNPALACQPRWHSKIQSAWAKRLASRVAQPGTVVERGNVIPFRRGALLGPVIVAPLGLPVQLDCSPNAITLLTPGDETTLDLAQARKLGRYLIGVAESEAAGP